MTINTLSLHVQEINARDPTTPRWTIYPDYSWHGDVEQQENYFWASVSFMLDFEFYRLAVVLIPNNVSHSSNYNVDLLQRRLKETSKLEIYRFTNLVASDIPNSETYVARFLFPMVVQFDREMHQFNLCLKYIFGICDNYRIKYTLDKNGMFICNSSGKKVICKVIVTLGGSFLEG